MKLSARTTREGAKSPQQMHADFPRLFGLITHDANTQTVKQSRHRSQGDTLIAEERRKTGSLSGRLRTAHVRALGMAGTRSATARTAQRYSCEALTTRAVRQPAAPPASLSEAPREGAALALRTRQLQVAASILRGR